MEDSQRPLRIVYERNKSYKEVNLGSLCSSSRGPPCATVSLCILPEIGYCSETGRE